MKKLKNLYDITIRNRLSMPYIPVNGYIHPVDRCRYMGKSGVYRPWLITARRSEKTWLHVLNLPLFPFRYNISSIQEHSSLLKTFTEHLSST